MDIIEYLQEKKNLIDQQLDQLLPDRTGPLRQLFQAARYSLFGKGKRIRPILALAASEIFAVEETIALIPACTLEIIHTYSVEILDRDLATLLEQHFKNSRKFLKF